MDSERSDSPAQQLSFPSHLRLRQGGDFERIYALKQKAGDERLLIFAALNNLPHNRLGLSIGRKHGGSVQRHRLRRLVKEAFRLDQHTLPVGLDFIVIPGREAATSTVDDFRASLRNLLNRLQRRIKHV